MKLLKGYGIFVGLAIVLICSAVICYHLAYDDPELTDKRVSQITGKFDDLYKRNADQPDKRDLVIQTIMQEQQREFSRVVLAHLAEAFVIASVMLLTVEAITKHFASKELLAHTEAVAAHTKEVSKDIQGQADKVSQNVWNAIFQRLVPDDIAIEIKRILKGDVCRIRPEYTITFTRAPFTNLASSDQIIVRRELYYRLLNLTGGQIQYPLSIKVLSTLGDQTLTDANGERHTLPRICKVKANETEYQLNSSDRTSWTRTITLPPMTSESQAISVYSQVEELYEVNDRALYILSAPCYGLRVDTVNQLPGIIHVVEDMVFLTSGTERLVPTTTGKWSCESGLLTGTALSISWKATQPSAHPVSITTLKNIRA